MNPCPVRLEKKRQMLPDDYPVYVCNNKKTNNNRNVEPDDVFTNVTSLNVTCKKLYDNTLAGCENNQQRARYTR